MPVKQKIVKPSVAHKKRTGKHHRQSKTYLKSYWPYIPMLLIIGLGFFVNTSLSSHQVLGASSDLSPSSLLSNTNQQRRSNHEAALTIDPRLTSAAQAKANDMSKRDYWSHDTPDGQAPWTFVVASGYDYDKAGENLAYGFASAEQTVVGWMNSPEHRENILNKDYQNVGFGVASNPNFQGKGPETIIVALYGRPAGVASKQFDYQAAAADVPNNREASASPVSRIQLLTAGQAPWSVVAMSTILGATLAIFVTRHGLYWHRLIRRGEHFVVAHPYLDLSIVSLGMLAFILIQSAGIIR